MVCAHSENISIAQSNLDEIINEKKKKVSLVRSSLKVNAND